MKEVHLKFKSFLNPWMTRRLKKSFNRKQKFKDKFLQPKTNKNEKKYETCKSLFEAFKKLNYTCIRKFHLNNLHLITISKSFTWIKEAIRCLHKTYLAIFRLKYCENSNFNCFTESYNEYKSKNLRRIIDWFIRRKFERYSQEKPLEYCYRAT